jgi:monoamine oxidase
MRQARMALRGHTAELLAKAVSRDALDAPMTADDKEKLLALLSLDGGLTKDLVYANRGAAGFREWPGAGDRPGIPADPLGLWPLVRAGYGTYLGAEHEINQQLTMFQPVGGIDALPRGFAKRLGRRVRYGARVTEIRKTAQGARIVYVDARGTVRTVEAPYCICAIPLPVLRTIPNDFSAPFAGAIARVAYQDSTKVGLEFKRRFWEEDDRIGRAGARHRRPHAPSARRWRCAKARESIRNTIPNDYPLLTQPDGPFYLAGEHMSYINAWQAGALESARLVASAIHRRVQRGGTPS